MPSERTLEVDIIKNLVIAGWTGRNVAALEAHIQELEALGVKCPRLCRSSIATPLHC